jgi:hypothetical protein
MKYEYRKAALYYPESCAVFPVDQVPPAFEWEEKGFSDVHAWWLSNLSHLAYFDRKEIESHLNRVGLQLFAYFSKNGSHAFIATQGNVAILSFRGTAVDERNNIMNDIDIRLTPLSENILVHRGFLRSLDNIWPEIEMALDRLEKKHIKIWYTGHSLGAAMATIAAARRKPVAVYAFGSPHVGNKAFCELLYHQTVYRIVNCCDAVTFLPPEFLGYRKQKKTIFITPGGKLLNSPSSLLCFGVRLLGYITFYRNLYWLRPDSVLLRSLADHIIVNYSNAFWDNIDWDQSKIKFQKTAQPNATDKIIRNEF